VQSRARNGIRGRERERVVTRRERDKEKREFEIFYTHRWRESSMRVLMCLLRLVLPATGPVWILQQG
jgi:hypothetical protein